jgi:tRNA A37 threonylcarbamoyladenosine dehydratase
MEATPKLHRRWDRMGRLAGDPGMARLRGAHVLIIGVGGVGSFAAEAIARSGVGKISIMDFDLICTTNTNRQLQAMKDTVGKSKVSVLAARLRNIAPDVEIVEHPFFYEASVADRFLTSDVDFVIDAIDNLTTKCHLIATCKAKGIPLVVSTGASGRWDPTRIQNVDLADTTVDPLAASCRKILRKNHGFPAKGPFGVTAVYSDEPLSEPMELAYDKGEGFRCVCPQGQNDLHSCEHRSRIWGTAGFVTGAFGLACASVVVRTLVKQATETSVATSAEA